MANEVRLIDVDGLVKNFQRTKLDEVFPNWNELGCDAKAAVIRLTTKYRAIILSAPTIDPESLRPKGRWVYDEGNLEWACSECLCAAHVSFGEISGYILSDYCPNCGAKMEG